MSEDEYRYNPGAAHNPFQGSPAEQAAYARSELQDAFMEDSPPADTYEPRSSLQFDSVPFDGHGSHASFNLPDTNDPTFLFTLLEDALHKQADTGRPLTIGEQQQKRDQIEHMWERVRRWMYAHPNEEERRAAAFVRGQADATPLHLMCKLHNPPEDVIAALVDVAIETVEWTDSHGWLPLHHACANGASPEVLKILIDAYPDGKLHQDNQSRTPLHFYVTRKSDNVTSMTLNAEMLTDSGAATLADRGGMLPMHYACAYGTHPAVLKVLAAVYPESLFARENHGRTPLHLAMVNAHRDASPETIRFLLSHAQSKATINTRDKDGFLPLHLLALGLKGYRLDDPDKKLNVSNALLMYLAAEPTPTADFLTAIQDLPDWLQDTAVVSKHVRNVLNEKIVKRFPTSILMLDGYVLIILIVFFAIATKNNIDLRLGTPGEYENTTQGAVVVLFMGAGYFFLREVFQIVSLMSLGSFSSWWKDMSNWLDLAVIVLVTYYAALMADGSAALISDNAFRSGVAFTQGLLWLAIIVFLKKTLVDFAVFVGGVFYVVKRLAAFLMAVTVILLAFAQMFYFVYVETDLCDGPTDPALAELSCTFPHCSFGGSLLKVYTMMMGEVNTETRYSTSLVAQILYVLYAFLVIILLSNVLIAIVTDSYEIIQNDRAAIVFWNNRLDFVAEMEAITYGVQRRLKCCRGSKAASKDIQEAPETDRSEFPGLDDDGASNEYFRDAWHQVMLLFDTNLYDDIDWIESCVYNLFRMLCIFFVIPLWIAVGLVTAGWFWPPQVREYLFMQKETAVSRAEIERQKLEQLKHIQDDIKTLKADITREMANDRDEMARMRTEVETIQSEVLSDLQQVRELMSSLLG